MKIIIFDTEYLSLSKRYADLRNLIKFKKKLFPEIIQISFLKCSNIYLKNKQKKLNIFIKIKQKIPKRITKLTNITSNILQKKGHCFKESMNLIDKFIDSGRCEFLSAFGVQLPLRVIVSQLGAPMSDVALFRKWTEAFIGNLSQQLDRDGLIQAAKDMLEFQHYFAARIEERRLDPQQDILSKIVNASIDGEKQLSIAESLSMISQILVAGNETTSASLSEGIWLLIENPDQYELLRENPSPEMISRFVEEVLRISSPSSNMFRRADKEVVMQGVTVPKDAILFARFASANQDEEQFPEPESFNLMRDNLKDQVAFGKGVHHCLGAALSRREMNIGFRVILERLENFRLAEDASPPSFSANVLLHGLSGLDLAFDKVR